jgi:hypothetical protein
MKVSDKSGRRDKKNKKYIIAPISEAENEKDI